MFAQFTANPMRLNWIKALFWCWAVLAILWVLASGWHAYNTTYLHLPFQPQTDCWGPIAKWPDGKPFDEWDRYGAVELDVPSNVEINKKNGEWAADSIAERNRWRESIWQKVKDCEAAKPLVQRIALGVTENWSYLISSLQLILLPPLVVLMASFIFGWIVVRGFRAK
jgi:hypothetical protein